jgi:SAM-dependent methyltransferase
MSSQAIFPATAMPDAEWWHALWPQPESVVAAIGITTSMRVIDLCCGDGWFTLPIARVAQHVVAIDLDPRMLQLTSAALEAAKLTNCDLIEGDAYDVALLVREPADFLLMANTFHGVPDKQRLAQAMAAVLKPFGKLAVINWHRLSRQETVVLGQPRGPRTDMRLEPAEVAAALQPAHLILAEVVELPPFHYAAIFMKPAYGKR